MAETTREHEAHCRYLMYDNPERTKAWRLDVSNYDGKRVVFKVNGKYATASQEKQDAVLLALTALDIAFAEFIIDRNKEER